MKVDTKISLLTKISLAIAGAILFIEVVLFIPSLSKKKNETIEKFNLDQLNIFQAINDPLNYFVKANRLVDGKMLMDILSQRPEFQFYILTDYLGKPIFQSEKSQTLQHLKKLEWKKTDQTHLLWHHATDSGIISYQYILTASPQSHILYAAYGTRLLKSEVKLYALRIISLTIVIIAFSVLVIDLVLTPIIMTPIRRIVQANETSNLIDEKYFTNDEIGSVMRSREEMLAKLYDYQENLEQKVKDRTKELEKAYEKLQVLDYAKDDFLTLISHEMRTPLSIIKNSFQMVKDVKLAPEQQQKIVEAGISNTKRLEKLSSLSLDIATLTTKGAIFKPRPVSLLKSIEMAQKNLEQCIQSQKITVHLKNENQEIIVYGHEEKLARVFEYILENAIQHSSQGSAVDITLVTTDKEVLIQLQDFGTGIDKAQLQTLFQPFVIHKDMLSHSKGLGLSLYWAKNIIDLHQGTLTCESEKGKGTVFTIRLPLTV